MATADEPWKPGTWTESEEERKRRHGLRAKLDDLVRQHIGREEFFDEDGQIVRVNRHDGTLFLCPRPAKVGR